MTLRKRLGKLRWIWPMVVVGVALAIPWGCHARKPARTLDVLVVDKTVPFKDRREHRSLYWLLRHLKIRKPDGAVYRADDDYLGAFPGPRPGDPPLRTTELTSARATRADLVYLVDTYGVYEGDLVSGRKMRAALERSRKIYGGLEPSEALAARRAVESGGLLLAEFNSFASPTRGEARRTVEHALGVRWTRWVGRYFSRLQNENEVPEWMRRNYETIHSQPWKFRGPGYVVLRDDERIEVLVAGKDTARIGLTIERELPVDPLLRDAGDGIPYPYWFDIVEPTGSTRVLASYAWHLEPSGAEKLRRLGLPRRFPAMCRRTVPGGGMAYYCAGDFADNLMYDRSLPLAGYLRFKRWFEALKLAPSDSAFYWRFYVPMMTRLLEERAG